MRGVITLVFDDGYEHVLHTVVPLLNDLKIRAVFAVPLNNETVASKEELPVAPWIDWLTIRQTGHEIAAHTINHHDLTRLSGHQLEHELREPAERLNATTLVYPGGAYNPSVVAAARQYYRAARTVEYGLEHLPPKDPFRLHTINYTRRNFTLWKANARALWAWLTNAWLIETYHIVSDDNKDKIHAVNLQDFKKHLLFIKKLPLNIKTINSALRP